MCNYLPLSNEQKKTLVNDLDVGVNFEESFSRVSEKTDLAFLLNTIRVLGFIDKNFSEIEKAAFTKLEKIVLAGLNLKAMTAQVEAMEKESYHEREVYKDYNKSNHHSINSAHDENSSRPIL